jgi:DHA1 family tetracycline resistance protein-like MFS transporter
MTKNLKRLSPLLLIIFLDSLSYFIAIPILLEVFFNQSYGFLSPDTSTAMRNFLTGFAISISTFAAIIAAPVIGMLSDHYGRRKTLLGCLITMMIGFTIAFIGIAQRSVFLVLMGRCIGGIGSASQPVGQATVADLCTGQDKVLFFGWISIAMTLSIVIAPLLGNYFSSTPTLAIFGLGTPYFLMLVLLVLNFVLIFFCFKETLALSNTSLQRATPGLARLFTELPKLVKNYSIGLPLLIFFLIECAWGQYYQTIGLYFRQILSHEASTQITQNTSWFLTSLAIWMSLGLFFLNPFLTRRFTNLQNISISVIGMLIGVFLCIIFPGNISQWIFAPLIAIFVGTGYVNLLTLISDKIEAKHQGLVMGYASTLLYSAWMITALISGLIISWNLYLPFYCMVVVMGVAVLALWSLHKKTKVVMPAKAGIQENI